MDPFPVAELKKIIRWIIEWALTEPKIRVEVTYGTARPINAPKKSR
jgi:hypothetical protein